MAASRASRHPFAALAAAACLLVPLGSSGCRGTPQPVVRADKAPAAKKEPAVVTKPTTPTPAAPTPAAPPAAPTESPEGKKPEAVVVDAGVEDRSVPETLVEASKAERKRRSHAKEPFAVINDKTLHKYASKGQLTVAGPKEKEKAADPGPAAPLDPRDEQYWRGRARDIRERWRYAADDIKTLEQKSTELRQKFYLESDTFNRDNQIKPEWDRVLDKLRQSRLDSEEAQKELAEFLEEGRAAGVVAGWLREGEDEEPEGGQPRSQSEGRRDAAPAAQSIEPPVIEPPAVEPPAGGRP